MTASNLGKSLFYRSLRWCTEGCSFQRDKQLCEQPKLMIANMAHWERTCPRFTAMCKTGMRKKSSVVSYLICTHTNSLIQISTYLTRIRISITVNLTGSILYQPLQWEAKHAWRFSSTLKRRYFKINKKS